MSRTAILLLALVAVSVCSCMVEAGRIKQSLRSRSSQQQQQQASDSDSSPPISSKYHHPVIDSSLEHQLPESEYVPAADHLAAYSRFDNEEFEASLLAMIEEHVQMNVDPPTLGQWIREGREGENIG